NQADRLALQYVTRFGAGLKATVADGRIASRNPSRHGEHQAECELRGRGARRAAAGIADGDALRGQRRAVDQCGARAGQPEHLELRQAGDQRGRKRRSLPRGEHDVEIGKLSSRVVLVRERRLEKLHVGTRHQRRPVGAAAGDVLPIVDYRNPIHRYSSFACAWLAFHHGSKSRLSFVSTAGRSRRPSPEHATDVPALGYRRLPRFPDRADRAAAGRLVRRAVAEHAAADGLYDALVSQCRFRPQFSPRVRGEPCRRGDRMLGMRADRIAACVRGVSHGEPPHTGAHPRALPASGRAPAALVSPGSRIRHATAGFARAGRRRGVAGRERVAALRARRPAGSAALDSRRPDHCRGAVDRRVPVLQSGGRIPQSDLSDRAFAGVLRRDRICLRRDGDPSRSRARRGDRRRAHRRRRNAAEDRSRMSPPAVALEGVSFRYPGTNAGVFDLTMTIASGELVVCLGPSGCGKTTLLRLVAGFLKPDAGVIRLNGSDVGSLPARARECGVVFQAYALFPHMRVWENVAYPLRVRDIALDERRRRAEQMLELVGLQGLAQRLPAQLSGGQQQRVALARALVFKPRALLLDEPLSALDAATRTTMRDEVRRIQRAQNIATLLITHDQDEALSLADRLVLLRDGRLVQAGSPQEIYDRPADAFVAGFVGRANLIDGRVIDAETVDTAIGRLATP